MNGQWRHLPPPARSVAVAASAAVTAAQRRDPAALTTAVAALAALDSQQTGLVLGTVVRLLLEQTHPDGLDGEDIRDVLERSVRESAEWQPDTDPDLMLVLLAGALGVADPEATTPTPETTARHAALLVADLLDGRPVVDQLTRAFHEIERSQVND
jgi:hypothetical protein